MKKRILTAILILTFLSAAAGAVQQSVYSPNGRIRVDIDIEDQLAYSVCLDNKRIIAPSAISMTLTNAAVIGQKPKLIETEKRVINETINCPVGEKRSVTVNHCNELTLTFKGSYCLIVRAYNDGVAYRFSTRFAEPVKIKSERASFVFTSDFFIYCNRSDKYFRKGSDKYHISFENPYKRVKISEIEPGFLAFAPVLVDIPNGPKIAITEADLDNYPGMFLTRNEAESNTIVGHFAPYPLEEEKTSDRHLRVTKRADYIAQTSGTRDFPWRVLVIAEKDSQLIESDMIYRLGKPLALSDTSWIKPGKVAWDWWNANNISGVDFQAGINTPTYKYYIDFASKNGIEYIILDEGWSNTEDLFELTNVDLHELIKYGRQRNVGIILWCVWMTIDRQMDQALDKFKDWGIKGVKVDFMDRDDQKVVQFYHKLAKATAEHQLLLNYHGSFKPTGLRRTYPNLITREGVYGLEQSKWATACDPEYSVTVPFIRMLAGPMDYTPGAMNNAQKDNFQSIFKRPMSQGTRCHQLAMYVIFESPLQMLCDTPTAYQNNPCCTEFIAKVPTVWDQTHVIDAKVGDYAIVARRKGSKWYIGALTDWTSREFTFDLSFLKSGSYQVQIIADGINASRIAIDHKHSTQKVGPTTKIKIKLAPGGGWAAIITPSK